MYMTIEAKIYNQQGKDAGTTKLPESVFGSAWNPDLVHQVIVGMEANARTSVAHTKDRSEVRGGGKKPWKQKGTGRARHGSIRSPIWRGGGVTFGPRNEKDYSKKINRKMRSGALASVLSKKLAEGELVFVDAFSTTQPKTAEARALLLSLAHTKNNELLSTKKHNTAIVVLPEKDENTQKSFANMGNVMATTAAQLNARDALKYARIIVLSPELSVPVLESRVTNTQTGDSK